MLIAIVALTLRKKEVILGTINYNFNAVNINILRKNLHS